MIYISIDIGIKHLSYCVYDDCEIEHNKHCLYDWNILNLTNEPEYTCYKCKNNAKYKIYNCGILQYSCGRHCKKLYWKQPKVKSKTKQSLIKYCLSYINHLKQHHLWNTFLKWFYTYPEPLWTHNDLIELDENPELWLSKQLKSKITWIWNLIMNHHPYYIAQLIKIKKSNAYSIQDIGIKLNQKLNELYEEWSNYSWWNKNIITILIEHQLSKHAVRMSMIQSMITQWFICNSFHSIVFVNASLKLSKPVIQKCIQSIDLKDIDTTTYSKRKQLSIKCVSNLALDEYWKQLFNHHKKKDDLADCLLQCLGYIFYYIY